MIEADIIKSDFSEWKNEPSIMKTGMVVVCREGNATLNINFQDWQMRPGSVITIFPYEGVLLADSSNFMAEALTFSKEIIHESSLGLENIVYNLLLKDRCCSKSPKITAIVNNILTLLSYYKELATPGSFRSIVMYQLRVFFIGFADYIQQHPEKRTDNTTGSRRVHELFAMFMRNLEDNYMEHHDVSYYAGRLNITTKYLNNIVQNITHNSTKEVIDRYIIMQLRLAIRSSDISISELAWKYKFSTLSFFTHYFKQHTGMTPKEYKNS